MAGRRKWSELRAKVASEVLAEAAVKMGRMEPVAATSIDYNANVVATRGVAREQPPIPGSERDGQGE